MIPEPTAKLATDIEYKLLRDFDKKVYSVQGQSKREVVERLIRNFLLENESHPIGFPKKKTQSSSEVKTIRRRKNVQS